MSNLRAPVRLLAWLAVLVAAWSSAVALAQRATPAPATAPPAARPPASLDRSVPIDRVIAIVNDEALTQFDINEQKRVVLGQMKGQNVTPPPTDVLEKQLLERLITERVLMQYAKETGIRVDDTQVERTIARIAQDNKLSLDNFRKAVESEGIPFTKYREDIRNEMIIQRLRDREVEGRVNVSDA
jgi:peptidyl-prolyl cis-trans isomerase SurA